MKPQIGKVTRITPPEETSVMDDYVINPLDPNEVQEPLTAAEMAEAGIIEAEVVMDSGDFADERMPLVLSGKSKFDKARKASKVRRSSAEEKMVELDFIIANKKETIEKLKKELSQCIKRRKELEKLQAKIDAMIG